MFDYGWRHYMPDLGRWNGMDQLSEKYNTTSPYAYVLNNPINMYDPDGRLTKAQLDYIWKNSGTGATSWGFNGDGGPIIKSYSGWNSSIGSTISSIAQSEGGGMYSYWTGAMSSTSYMGNNSGYVNYEIGVLHKLKIYGSIPEVRQSYYGINGLNTNSIQNIDLDIYKDWVDWSASTAEGGLKYIVKRRTALYESGYWIDNLGQRRSVAYAGRSRGSLIGLRSDYLRNTAILGKYAKRAGMVGNVISAGEIGYGVYEDNWRYGKNAQVATAGVVGGMAGAAAGAWALGKAGGFIGTFVGPEGTVVGAAIGGIVGGIAGGVLGGDLVEGWAEDLF